MNNLTDDDWDALGRMVDSLDNAIAAKVLAVPDSLKIEGMTGIVTDVRNRLKRFVINKSSFDPWS